MMRTLVVDGLVLAGIVLLHPDVVGQDPPAAEPAAPPLRHLIVVERSAAMERQRERAADVASRLILSGLNGRAQPGEGIGVWVAGSSLETNLIPVTAWDLDPMRQLDFGNQVFRRLREPERKDHAVALREALAAATVAMQGSTQFVAVVIASGATVFEGTPFDQAVNALFSLHAQAMGKAGKPFVIAMVGDEGRWVKHAVTPGEEHRAPHIPLLPPKPAPVTNHPPAETSPVVRMGTPLIMTNPPRLMTVREITAQLNEAKAREAAQTQPAPDAAVRPTPPTEEAVQLVPRGTVPEGRAPAENALTHPAAATRATDTEARRGVPLASEPPAAPPAAPALAAVVPQRTAEGSPAPATPWSQMLFGALLLGAGCLLGWFLTRQSGSGK